MFATLEELRRNERRESRGFSDQEFAYDGLGRPIASMDNSNPAETSDDVFVTWRHDSLGRQIEETLRIGQGSTALNPVTTNYRSTQRASLAHPNGHTVEYTYLAGGAMSEIKDSGAADLEFNKIIFTNFKV